MTVMPKQTKPLDLVLPDVAYVSVEIGLFDDDDHEDDHRVVPLALYLQELTTQTHKPR